MATDSPLEGRRRKEWVGRHPDSPIPPKVRLRVFLAHGGTCHLSGRKILPGEPWDVDHVIALINGGEHRENNLAPALRDKHRAKTATDVAEKSLTFRKRKKHWGIKKPSKFPFSRGSKFKQKIGGKVVLRSEEV